LVLLSLEGCEYAPLACPTADAPEFYCVDGNRSVFALHQAWFMGFPEHMFLFRNTEHASFRPAVVVAMACKLLKTKQGQKGRRAPGGLLLLVAVQHDPLASHQKLRYSSVIGRC
jgi:hypothetical protein